MHYLGIDIGSTTCETVVVDSSATIVAASMVPTGARNSEAIRKAMVNVLDHAGITQQDIQRVVSTGYGRERVENRTSDMTEIACHARGIKYYFPETELLIDIGGQDSKAIRIGASGRVVDFSMNDKCAAGTGRFLETMARVLEVSIQDIGNLDVGAVGTQSISSMCTVFAESEVVSLVAQGVDTREIAYALNKAIAARTFSMARSIAHDFVNLKIAMSGGVAKNKGVIRALQRLFKTEIFIPAEPDMMGAVGAAMFALDGSDNKP